MKEFDATSIHFYASSATYLEILENRNESDFTSIQDVIHSYAEKGTILEFGCGVGLLSALLAKKGYTVTGVDISEQFIQSAKKKFGNLPSLAYRTIRGLPLPYLEGSFDLVVTSAVLEHCTGIDAILLEFRRVLKPQGLLIIETPNMLSPLARGRLIVERIIGRRKRFHRYGTPKVFIVNLYYLLKKMILQKPEFIYVEPNYSTFSEADEDVTYLSNPLDYLYFLRTHDFDVLELTRNTGKVRKFIGTYLPYIAGGVMIVARKQ